ncbi:hypothetical protein M422DRAFT_122163, partial [Sphaerobolus stellatus SS14]
LSHFSFAQTANGWTDNDVCHQWFEKTFVPWSRSRNISGQPILWVCDGHGSHETTEMEKIAYDNNIIMLCLPPHVTHMMQPLDVGVFGPFQKAWVKHCEDSAIEGDPVTQFNIVHRYMKIRAKYVTKATVTAAFKHSGIWPINRDVFTKEDFAPSLNFSTEPSMPSSFP